MKDVKSVLLAGVGGQGILLASTVLAKAALFSGYQVKTNEVHGMAQRGGSVVAEIRYGKHVHSPLIEPGKAVAIASLEQGEALRYAHYLAPGGLTVVAATALIPVTASSGTAKYPTDIPDRLKQVFPRLIYFDPVELAQQAGSAKCANLVLLGALSTGLSLGKEVWEKAILDSVKVSFAEMNLKAFYLGAAVAQK